MGVVQLGVVQLGVVQLGIVQMGVDHIYFLGEFTLLPANQIFFRYFDVI